MVIGLDCAAPQMMFDRYVDAMPWLASLMRNGTWGTLASSIPPITVPAWACMVSGRDPGQLGLYGFRDRRPGGYDLTMVDARDVGTPRVWDLLGQAQKRVAVLFVPPSYPPSSVCGEMVSCFLTPGNDRPHTFPERLQQELTERFGPYLVDVEDPAGSDRWKLLAHLRALAEQHFAIAEHIWRTRQPDFLMMVEIGLDRFQHAFWQHIDPEHPDFIENGPYAEACRDYYRCLDAQIGRLVTATDENTAVLVVSDHGARALRGGICINEWLIDQGYLRLNHYPTEATPLESLDVDWSATRAWGEGGYYARVFLNVQGREPLGAVPRQQYLKEREQLARSLQAIVGPQGETLDNKVVSPDEVYGAVRGSPPDLFAFFDDLGWRSIGSVGHGRMYTHSDDRKPDGCNHHWDGIFVMSGAGAPRRGHVNGYRIYDVASTILGLMDVPIPDDLLGIDRSS